MKLAGSTVLLTGSNRGIGHALLDRLAREPVRLLAGVRELERFQPPGTSTPAGEVRPVRVDLSSRDAIDASVRDLGDEIDGVDVLINNAGEWAGGTFDAVNPDDLYAAVQSNLAGLMHLTRAVLPGMLARGNGKIVNQSSIVAYANYPGTAVYAATKAGVSAFTKILRRELRETPVTTLELITGGNDTAMLKTAAKDLDPHADPSSWEFRDPARWADAVVDAIESDKRRLEPGGRSQLARLAGSAPDVGVDAVSRLSF
jgi:NADP-dependent 3-hydroxy acid dehydrogenase YdfG